MFSDKLFDKLKFLDLIVGPVPERIKNLNLNLTKKKKVRLANKERYTKIIPIPNGGRSAFISIMRGCDNMCTFCIVPYCRGREKEKKRKREKSRNPNSILKECKLLYKKGYKEIILLGQTVPLLRVRFLTSYPSNITKNLLKVVKKYSNNYNQVVQEFYR